MKKNECVWFCGISSVKKEINLEEERKEKEKESKINKIEAGRKGSDVRDTM